MMEEAPRIQIQEAINQSKADMLDFTRRMVALATENPPGRAYKECAALIADELSRLGLKSQVTEVPDPAAATGSRGATRHCLLSHFGSGQRTLYFHGHYDVVPASGPAQFEPLLKDGCLFGRGSADMKSGLAAMIYAVKAIKDCGFKLDGRIGLCIVPDEETGGRLGSAYLSGIGALGRDGVGMLMPEPTGGVVWNANRGAVTLGVKIKGKPAHVGQQYRGDNAFEKMLLVAKDLQDLKQEVEARTTAFTLQPEAARRSILMLGGVCRGGSGFNLVPGEVFFTLDRRINPEEDLPVEKRRLLDRLAAWKGKEIELEVEILQEGLSSGTPEDTPLARALAANVAAVTGRRPAFEMCPGLLEIRFYLAQGIPALAYGPGGLESAHGPREFVRVDEIYDCAAIYALTALDVLRA